jgi:hypothetical protein
VGKLSCYFQIGDVILWNPSNLVAQLFIQQAKSLAASTGVESGIGGLDNDECDVDLPVFNHFIEHLVDRYRRSNHGVLRALMAGFLATSMVLVQRAGGRVPTTDSGRLDDWNSLFEDLPHSMPT